MKTSNDTGTGRRPGGRRLVVSVVASAVVVASAFTVTAWQKDDGTADSAKGDAVRTATAVVTRSDLSNAQTLDGSLGYGRATTVKGGRSGLITWLPPTGATVKRGEPLYRVDNVPVPVFYGGTPLYRTLEARGTTGPDVKTVADNLGELGYDIGAQPAVGTWVSPEPVTSEPVSSGTASAVPTSSAAPSPSPTPSRSSVVTPS